jgi:predicted GNAT family acetyltransferase
MPETTPAVTHEPHAHRFVADTDDGPAVLTYEHVGPDVLDLQHTLVPEDARGEGVGEALVQAAFEYARTEGLHLIPTCPFVRAWVEKHPEARAQLAR